MVFQCTKKLIFRVFYKVIKASVLACAGTNHMTVCITYCLTNICRLLVKLKSSFIDLNVNCYVVLDECISIHHLRCFCSQCLFCLSYKNGNIRHRPASHVWRIICVTQCVLRYVSYLSLCMPTFRHFSYNPEKVTCVNCRPVMQYLVLIRQIVAGYKTLNIDLR